MILNIENNWMLTGGDSMLGRYLRARLEQSAPQPELTLFHCDGTDANDDAMRLNLEATERLLSNLPAEPRRVVYVSSWQVYSPDAGEGVDETRPTFAWSEAGKSRARTELLLEKWAAAHGATLTIVRPAQMFGTGVDGAMLQLFNRAIRGHYVHIRGNEAKTSAVTALDAAEAIVRLAGQPGIFNISDGLAHRWIDLVEAMTANAGAQKRMTHLPPKWAAFFYRWFRFLPIVEQTLSPAALEPMSRTLVLDNSKTQRTTGMTFHNTHDVIARRDKTYPYENS